jgi:toxin-antitoxin system PIN domain toxin
MGYLLDANILIAILDRDHVHHRPCRKWFESVGHHHWHTCPTTENGAIRVLSGGSYPGKRQRPDEAIERLESLLTLGRHEFIRETMSIRDRQVFIRMHLRGAKQITDTYLLGVAVASGATFATRDHRLDPNTVHGGEDHLLMIG